MSNCCSETNIWTLDKLNGLNINHSSGPYSWPYASCTGKVNKKGIFIPLTAEEGLTKCLEFCKKRKKLTGQDPSSLSFTEISGIGNTKTGSQQCHMIYNFIQNQDRNQNRENFITNPPGYNLNFIYWVIPLVLFSFILLSLIVLI